MAPIVKNFPSYIKESQHALEIFRDFSFLGQNKVILTMDITSLYTVIRNGLQALKHFFDHRTVKEPSSDTLLRLVELALTLNCFSFRGSYYKQTNVWPWDLEWDPATPIFLQVLSNINFLDNTTAQNLNSTAVTLTIASALPPPPKRSSLNL